MMWGQLLFQDASSPLMNALAAFHDNAMIPISMISCYVIFAMMALTLQPYSIKAPYENHSLEAVWTMSPAVILLTLALPSLHLLYLLDELSAPAMSIKTTGHQWYWSYEYADFNDLSYDSYMVPSTELIQGEFRLLEVDNRLVLPWGVETRVLITAADVLHSWTIPSMGVKADAIPGRLNQVTLIPTQPGVFYGQCSEICGANHSFMPIVLETISMKLWANWIIANLT